MSDHAFLPPSGAACWVACPAWPSMNALYPEEDDDTAREGTAAHWAAVEVLEGRALPASAPNGVKIDEEMRKGVLLYTQHVASAYHAAVDAAGEAAEVKVEYRVAVPSVHTDSWGTTDAVLLVPQRSLTIWDFKYGHGFVDAFENWQLINYAAGILDEIEWSPDLLVTLNIVQPRNYDVSGPIRSWAITAAEVREYARRLEAAATEATGENPRSMVGPHCVYCPGRHVCQALQRAGYAVLNISAGHLPNEMPPDALGRELSLLTSARDLLNARITGLSAQASALIRGGAAVPGWELAKSRGREEWTVTTEELKVLGEMLGLSLVNEKPVTPAQARDAGVDAAVISGYSQRKEGELKLSPISIDKARKVFGK